MEEKQNTDHVRIRRDRHPVRVWKWRLGRREIEELKWRHPAQVQKWRVETLNKRKRMKNGKPVKEQSQTVLE
jgi:hypothetical protein